MGWSYTLSELADVVSAATEHGDVRVAGVSTDTRTIREGNVFFALKGENFDGNSFVDDAFSKGAAAAVASKPSSNGPCVVVDDALVALQAFSAFHRARHTMPLFALTGSCGKTSTKEMVASVLASRYRVVKTEGNLNNEIGCPLSLLQIDGETDIAVIEMGANHAGEIRRLCELARPTEAAITMIAPAHLEGFGSVENVARAKQEIVDALEASGTYYVNGDDPRCRDIAEGFAGRTVVFGGEGDIRLDSCELDAGGEMSLDIAPVGKLRLPLVCRAHTGNVLLAVAVGLEHGVTEFEDPLRAALAATSRCKALKVGPIEVIDDTYNANPASMEAALRTLVERPGGKRLAALGDMLELGEQASRLHAELGGLAASLGVAHILARGEYADRLVEAARAAGAPDARHIEAHDDMAAAIAEMVDPGDVLLVKGSRGMRMEKVIEVLRTRWER